MTTAQDQQSRAEFDRGVSVAPVLRAMTANYASGHEWDELDAMACNSAASQIERLEAELQAARALPAGMEPAAYIPPRALAGLQDPHYMLVQHQVTLRATKRESDGVGLFTGDQVQAMLAQEKASRQAAQQQLEASKAELAKLEKCRFMLRKAGDQNGANQPQTRMNAGDKAVINCPSDWQAVPVEPTGEMISSTRHDDVGIMSAEQRNRHVYRAMLAAAPRPPAAQEVA